MLKLMGKYVTGFTGRSTNRREWSIPRAHGLHKGLNGKISSKSRHRCHLSKNNALLALRRWHHWSTWTFVVTELKLLLMQPCPLNNECLYRTTKKPSRHRGTKAIRGTKSVMVRKCQNLQLQFTINVIKTSVCYWIHQKVFKKMLS